MSVCVECGAKQKGEGLHPASPHLPLGLVATTATALQTDSGWEVPQCVLVPRTQKLVEIKGATGSFVKAKPGDSVSGWAKPKQRCFCLRGHSWKLQFFFFSVFLSPKPLSLAYSHKNEKTGLRKWRAEAKQICVLKELTISSQKQVSGFMNVKYYIFVDKGTP